MAPLSKTARETLIIALANKVIGNEIADSIDQAEVDPLSLRKDGQNSPTANIPWAGFKITGLGAPTLAGDAVNKNYVDTSVGTAALKLDGTNSPTATVNWGNQDLINVKNTTVNLDLTLKGKLLLGTAGTGQALFQAVVGGAPGEGVRVDGQTSGNGMGFSIFSKDSNGTGLVGIFVFGSGNGVTASESLQFGWEPASTSYVIKATQFAGGTFRPLVLQAGSGGSTKITINTTAVVGVQLQGNLALTQAGRGLQIKTGTNQMAGTATLVGGTVTIANANVTANTVCLMTVKTLGTVTAPQALRAVATAGVNVVITSADPTDTSVVQYMLLEAN